MTKFILRRYRSDQGTLILFGREDNGMVIGAVRETEVQFGEEPAKIVVRAFLTHEQAVDWAKQQCRLYAGRDDIEFTVEDGNQIVVPRPNVRMPGGRIV